MTESNEFQGFGKIARLSRPCTVTEKIDGTTGCVFIRPADPENYDNACDMLAGDVYVRAGSRTQWISPDKDNYGFARWVWSNSYELAKLGHGRHFGEWWGQGIQRKYGLSEKRFSLFNTSIWSADARRPSCCSVVPVLYEGEFSTVWVNEAIERLRMGGSVAAPGFDKPEGVIIYHHAAGQYFKKTLDKDEEWKGKQ